MPQFTSIYAIPTGGAIGLQFSTAASGTISLSRATSGTSGLSAFTTIYSGASTTCNGSGQFFADVGDYLPGPLTAAALYVYQLTDSSGSVQSAPVVPVAGTNLEQDGLTALMIRLMQAGISNIQPPPGIATANVYQAMPLVGWPPMPFVVVTPELLQQEEVPIGQDVEKPSLTNTWTQTEQARRVYRNFSVRHRGHRQIQRVSHSQY